MTILEEAFFEAYDELNGKTGLKDHIKKYRKDFYKTIISVIEDKLKKETPIGFSGDIAGVFRVIYDKDAEKK